MNNHDIAELALKHDLISWRQAPRVKRGQPVTVAGGQEATPQDLLETIKQIEGE